MKNIFSAGTTFYFTKLVRTKKSSLFHEDFSWNPYKIDSYEFFFSRAVIYSQKL